jgi:hypothetical protein
MDSVAHTGPDLGGAAIRALSQYDSLPVHITGSTFSDGVCSNGGALSSIGVSWVVLNSLMTGNKAIGWGANPASGGTPGGGSGAAIYTDGDQYRASGTSVVGRQHRGDDRQGHVEPTEQAHQPRRLNLIAGIEAVAGAGVHPLRYQQAEPVVEAQRLGDRRVSSANSPIVM